MNQDNVNNYNPSMPFNGNINNNNTYGNYYPSQHHSTYSTKPPPDPSSMFLDSLNALVANSTNANANPSTCAAVNVPLANYQDATQRTHPSEIPYHQHQMHSQMQNQIQSPLSGKSNPSKSSSITEEQRKRIETKRLLALEKQAKKKRAKEEEGRRKTLNPNFIAEKRTDNCQQAPPQSKQMRHSLGGYGVSTMSLSQESSFASHGSSQPANVPATVYGSSNNVHTSSQSSLTLSQESTASSISNSNSNMTSTASNIIPATPNFKKPSTNPYKIRKSVSTTPVTKPEQIPDVSAEAEANIPPLPENAPPLREESLKKLSEQQLEVIKLARPPSVANVSIDQNNVADAPSGVAQNPSGQDGNKAALSKNKQQGFIVRLTACAGAGKTTNLLHLALRCFDLGHKNLTYVTFSKASAKDARDRITSLMVKEDQGSDFSIDAVTLHSCAMRVLMNDKDYDDDSDKKLVFEEALGKILEEEYEKEIENYLRPAINHMRDSLERKKWAERKRTLRNQVVFYLKKTFLHFCRSSMTMDYFLEKEVGKKYNPRYYYPVTIDFKKNGKAEKLGFPSHDYSPENSYRFYTIICAKFWEVVIQRNIRSYDIEMKKAQLKNIRIPCSVLLVDECQDLDACQVDLIAKQKDYGTHVFFVGDAAQTIYGFRGAKSSNFMSLPGCIDRLLTKSWRFGPAIARVANISLFTKEHCPQTTFYEGKDSKQWVPYRIEGARGEDESSVVITSLMSNWRENKPVTLIGRCNGSLMIDALSLMGLSSLQQVDDDSIDNDSCSEEIQAKKSIELDIEVLLHGSEIPKFHINGRGESSGIKQWRKTMIQIKHLHELFMAQQEGGSLPNDIFPEFAEEGQMTWGSFLEAVSARDLTKYTQAIQLISTYKKNTMKAVQVFQTKVISQNYCPEEADIILTSCHSAKGLEWDHVELCNDFLNISQQSYDCTLDAKHRGSAFLSESSPDKKSNSSLRKGWQFDLRRSGDDLNLLYVACTRARKTLTLPKSLDSLLREFDLIHYLVSDIKKAAKGEGTTPTYSDESTMMWKGKKLKKGQLWDLYHDLVRPIRQELGVPANSTIMEELFSVHFDEVKEEKTANDSSSETNKNLCDYEC